MICPHCGKDTQANYTMSPPKVRDLTITSWCPTCGKAKAYSGTLIFGNASDPKDLSPFPELCQCAIFAMINNLDPENMPNIFSLQR